MNPATSPRDGDLVVDDLSPQDVATVAVLFEDHTGRSADQATMASWVDRWPSAAARRGDRLVGYTLSQRFGPDVLELTSLLVAPDHRGNGVGSRMVRHLEDGARRCHQRAILVVTSSDSRSATGSDTAQRFYERLGYRPVVETAITTVLVQDL